MRRVDEESKIKVARGETRRLYIEAVLAGTAPSGTTAS